MIEMVNWREVSASHLQGNTQVNHRVLLTGVDNVGEFREIEKSIGGLVLNVYHPDITPDQGLALIDELHHAPNTVFVDAKMPEVEANTYFGIIGRKIRPSNHPQRRVSVDQLPLVRLHAVQSTESGEPHFDVVDLLIYARLDRGKKIRLSREIGPLKQYKKLEHTKVLCDF